MKNLQDLLESYLETRPSTGKIKNATAAMIHVCKALDISSQEEVTHEYFESIPHALDSHFFAHPLKATMDKTMLAEMIGRVGPKKSVKLVLDKLLSDKNANVRQFTLHSLEYHGIRHPRSIMPYIERFRKAGDEEMTSTAAMLVGNLQCSEQSEFILEKIIKWYEKKDYGFVEEILKRMIVLRKQNKCEAEHLDADKLKKWSVKNCPKVAKSLFDK